MKKIVFINQDSGYLMIDIVNAHVAKGYECVLITGRLVERNNLLDNRVKIEWIKKYNRNSITARVFSWVTAFIQIWVKVIFRYRKAKLFIVSNPPFIPLLILACKNNYSLMIFDVYIEKPAEIKYIRHLKLLVNIWQKAHRKVLAKAERIFTLTRGMANVLEKYSEGKKVEIVPVWTDNTYFSPIEKHDNEFLKLHSLIDKFIVLYSGNIGASSGVESIIEVARITKNKDIVFLIIGEGIRKGMLIKKSEEYALNNCVFLPWQDTKVLPFSMASADLALVTLANSASKRSIPSKFYNYLSVGAPVLAIANKESDLSNLIKYLEVGQSFDRKSINDISKYIEELYVNREKRQKYSNNALLASKKFTVENVNIITNDN